MVGLVAAGQERRLELVDLARQGGADCLVLRRSGDAEVITVPAPAILAMSTLSMWVSSICFWTSSLVSISPSGMTL